MKDRPIQVGDLVQVVRPPVCGCIKLIGITFKVSSFGNAERYRCTSCGFSWPHDGHSVRGYKDFAFQEYLLKRIPPLDELEGERTEEKLREPV